MKRLFIIRHAKAMARRAGLPDFERPLVKKGVKSARDLALRLKHAGVKPDLFVSSPANRALETAHAMAKEFGYPVQKIQLKDMLYEEASNDSLLGLVRGLDRSSRTVFLVGHNPALQEFAQFMDKEFPGRLPKSGVVGFEFGGNLWRYLSAGKAKRVFFDFPGREAEDSRRRTEDLAVQVARAVETVLERVNPAVLGEVIDVVENSSRKIAARFLAGLKEKQDAEVNKKPVHSGKTRGRPRKSAPLPRKPKTAVKPATRAKPRPKVRTSAPGKLRYAKPVLEKKDDVMPDVRPGEDLPNSYLPASETGGDTESKPGGDKPKD
jgi:phosphohistidine phosphatase